MSSHPQHAQFQTRHPQQAALVALQQRIVAKRDEIEAWFAKQWQQYPTPLYCSVDLRHASFKLAPIDTNMFPAGFNNLSDNALQKASNAFYRAVQQRDDSSKTILLIAENHTRNPYYLLNLNQLAHIIKKAGFSVILASLDPQISTPQNITLANGTILSLHPLQRQGSVIQVANSTPDFILLNNDLSSGHPAILENIAQPIYPSLNMGWTQRLKSVHFAHYHIIAREFAKLLGIDSWLISTYSESCGEVDFLQQKGQACLLRHSEAMLTFIQQKYREYNIAQDPFIFIKTETGTYGMGVMVIHSLQDITTLSHRTRMHMAKAKGRRPITQVILQEGVPSNDINTQTNAVAEPVIYLMANEVIGGFYRCHQQRNDMENLNTPGMQLIPAEFDLSRTQDYCYAVIARLAQLTASREMMLNNH